MNKKIIYYFGSTFTYGFYRGSTFTKRLTLNDEEERKEILLPERISNGIITGICYANPILQPLFLSNLINRIENKVRNKENENENERKMFRSSYRDIYTYNYRTL
jgi:hypothetical protein